MRFWHARRSLMCSLLVLACANDGGRSSAGDGADEAGSTEGGGAESSTRGEGGESSDATGEVDGETDTGSAESDGDDGVETGSTTTEALAPLPEVVIVRANDGRTAMGSSWSFEMLAVELEALGRTVTDTSEWPASFDQVGLVLLVVNAEPFSAEQIADLEQVLGQGGMVIVQNEWSYYAETENLNALLAALGSALSFEDALLADAHGGTIALDDVGDHPFMAGIESLLVAAGSAVLGCEDGVVLLSAEGQCYLAAEPHDAGWLLAFGDADILDDHVLMAAAPEQNYALLGALEAAVP
jgi:hypothetical protein